MFEKILSGLFVSLFVIFRVYSQTGEMQDGYHEFRYPSGKRSSAGMIRDGKPDGYWKTYYENGNLKSEGNRKNFELDSNWKFYNEDGKLLLEINYAAGKKNGVKRTYLENEIQEENFVNDSKEGWSNTYYPDYKLKSSVKFVNGMETGFGKEYDRDGTVIMIMEFKKGFMVDRLKINRKDHNGLKQGKWMEFWENGNIHMETDFVRGKKTGYQKEYDRDGKLMSVTKYLDDIPQPDAPETRKLDMIKDYDSAGNLRVSATYLNGKPEGIWREYNPDGSVSHSFIYHEGIKMSEGVILDDGSREGPWKDFYPDGKLRAEGNYKSGKQTGKWKFYYQNGKLEQQGSFTSNGKLQGEWNWYFDNGQLWRRENFLNGLHDGRSEEFDEKGVLVTAGDYIDDKEEGNWFLETGDYREEGTYSNGMKQGYWKFYYLYADSAGTRKEIAREGSFVEDLPDGKHTTFWPGGKVKEQGEFLMGKKEGDWILFREDGSPFLVITYVNGVETRYDGSKIKPPYENQEP